MAETPLSVGLGLSESFLYCDGFRQAGEGASMPSGVYDLDEIKKDGKSRNWCPYYLIRRVINRQLAACRDDDCGDGSRCGV